MPMDSKQHRPHDGRKNIRQHVPRISAHKRGYNYKWKQARQAYLAMHPLCATCQHNNRAEAATVVDHIKPHRGNDSLFWDQSNWQPLCKPCHDRKTLKEKQ